MKNLLIALLLIAACGCEDSSSSNESPTSNTKSGSEAKTDPANSHGLDLSEILYHYKRTCEDIRQFYHLDSEVLFDGTARRLEIYLYADHSFKVVVESFNKHQRNGNVLLSNNISKSVLTAGSWTETPEGIQLANFGLATRMDAGYLHLQLDKQGEQKLNRRFLIIRQTYTTSQEFALESDRCRLNNYDHAEAEKTYKDTGVYLSLKFKDNYFVTKFEYDDLYNGGNGPSYFHPNGSRSHQCNSNNGCIDYFILHTNYLAARYSNENFVMNTKFYITDRAIVLPSTNNTGRTLRFIAYGYADSTYEYEADEYWHAGR